MITLLATVLTMLGAGFVAIAGSAPQPDPFLRSLSYAITGTENAGLKVLDTGNCVFALNGEIFRLNAVLTDRIDVHMTELPSLLGPVKRVLVTLQGEGPIYERSYVAAPELAAPDATLLQATRGAGEPSPFPSLRVVSKGLTLTLRTDEAERVQQAWDFVYSHGCTGTAPALRQAALR